MAAQVTRVAIFQRNASQEPGYTGVSRTKALVKRTETPIAEPWQKYKDSREAQRKSICRWEIW